MLKKRTMNIDEIIRENEGLQLKLEEQKEAFEASRRSEPTLTEPKKEFREYGTQTSKKVLKTTSTQTAASNEDSKPKKNFISFFNTKGLFGNKKPKSKLVKFYQNGRLAHGKDVIPAFDLPGHRSFELNRQEFTLPHAREYNQELEQHVSEGPKSPKKKSRKLVESPKKETKKILLLLIKYKNLSGLFLKSFFLTSMEINALYQGNCLERKIIPKPVSFSDSEYGKSEIIFSSEKYERYYDASKQSHFLSFKLTLSHFVSQKRKYKLILMKNQALILLLKITSVFFPEGFW